LTAGAAPPEIHLNFEDVTGSGKPERYRVYLNLPDGADPANHRELYAGDLSMFGVREFGRSDATHSGGGMHFTLPIVKIVQTLESKGAWDPKKIRVTLVPKRPVQHEIRIGRISL
jgi:tyrosinase